jgi:hypothetical protein
MLAALFVRVNDWNSHILRRGLKTQDTRQYAFIEANVFVSPTVAHTHWQTLKMNWFGKKKETKPSTVSATSSRPVTDPQSTMVTLRENITMQEKRYVRFFIIRIRRMGFPYSC